MLEQLKGLIEHSLVLLVVERDRNHGVKEKAAALQRLSVRSLCLQAPKNSEQQHCDQAQRREGFLFHGTPCQFVWLLFLRMTSWLPPSTIEVEETTVSLAFSCSSSMESAPQLHMVERTL